MTIFCKSQDLKLLVLYPGTGTKDSSIIYKSLGISIVSDKNSMTIYSENPYCKRIVLPKNAFCEVFDEKFLICSINEEPKIGSSRPYWTFKREVIYILPLFDSNCATGKIYQCDLDGKAIQTSDTLKHINRNYKFDLVLNNIDIMNKVIYFKKVKRKSRIVLKLKELHTPVLTEYVNLRGTGGPNNRD